MAIFIYDWRVPIKNTLKLSILLLIFIMLPACAHLNPAAVPAEIATNDHDALAVYFENLAKEAKVKLHENKRLLRKYEESPYLFGRQGQDVKSHAAANIREYEKTLRESQNYADFHRKMAIELKGNSLNKAKLNQDRDLSSKHLESPAISNEHL